MFSNSDLRLDEFLAVLIERTFRFQVSCLIVIHGNPAPTTYSDSEIDARWRHSMQGKIAKSRSQICSPIGLDYWRNISYQQVGLRLHENHLTGAAVRL